jgi:two-component system chemotaxis response regulator CheY
MMRALVVDDSRTVRTVLRRILEPIGFDEVGEAGDGVEALAWLDANAEPDVMLVDWNMPRMSGIELVRVVRGARSQRDIPIVMVTTETELSQMVKALAAGASEYIMKPFTADVVLSKLQLLGIVPAGIGSTP